MKYPELSVVRFFFKNSLFEHPTLNPRVIEFGCGSGHNLRVFEEHGWECHGVDLFENQDFQRDAVCGDWNVKTQFYSLDLNNPLPDEIMTLQYDAVLFPSVTYYLHPTARLSLLGAMFNCLKPGGFMFLVERLDSDYRYGRGVRTGSNGYRLDITETGEYGMTIQFFSKNEILSTLSQISNTKLSEIVALEYSYENLLSDKIVRNSELVVWGKKSV